MYNVIEDVSSFSNVPPSYLKKLIRLSEMIIADEVVSEYNEGNYVAEFNIGIGQLILKTDSEGVEYRFIPSTEFEKILINQFDGENSLVESLEESFSKKLVASYKELI